MASCVLVTHAQPQRWIKALSQAGWNAQPLPLVTIAAVPDLQPVRDAWHDPRGWHAVMFVSSPAVQALAQAIGQSGVRAHSARGARAPRLWCTGSGTRESLLAHGFESANIDSPKPDSPRFDSEALWSQVADQVTPAWRVLVVRGDEPQARAPTADARSGVGRDWLADQVRTLGGEVCFVAAYARSLPDWTPAQLQLARQAASDGSIWLLASALALRHLAQLLPQQSWAASRAVCTHPRVAQAAHTLGFGQVHLAGPELQQVLSSLEFAP